MDLSLFLKTSLALLAFAGNSVLCRLALESSTIDPSSFTSIRLLSGAITLASICWFMSMTTKKPPGTAESTMPIFKFKHSDWLSGLSLFIYAAAFSFAYISLATGTGALILFASVQITMLGIGIAKGMRLNGFQWLGFTLAIIGLVYLLSPGLSAPPIFGAVLMMSSGVAWGLYSLKGKQVSLPTQASAENFLRALPYCFILSLVFIAQYKVSLEGILLAVVSGAVTSGLGYAIWYGVLPKLKAASAATLQLTVPVIATIGGTIWLLEPITLRLVIASLSILGGVALVVLCPTKTTKA